MFVQCYATYEDGRKSSECKFYAAAENAPATNFAHVPGHTLHDTKSVFDYLKTDLESCPYYTMKFKWDNALPLHASGVAYMANQLIVRGDLLKRRVPIEIKVCLYRINMHVMFLMLYYTLFFSILIKA